jgi:hypothetical protein
MSFVVAAVAQLVEHLTENQGVPSSNLGCGTRTQTSATCGRGSVVEHLLAKERVVGSNPIARSVLKRQVRRGDVAKWEGSGLQNRDHGFKSRRRLWAKGLIASRYQPFAIAMGRWRNGRRCGLKIRWGNTPYGFDSHPPYQTEPSHDWEGFAIPERYVLKLTPGLKLSIISYLLIGSRRSEVIK